MVPTVPDDVPDHLGTLTTLQHEFLEALHEVDLDAPVAACSPWTVTDLALHLGGVHWWAAAMALGADLDPHDPAEPRGRADLVRFYDWAARHVRNTLSEVGPDAPALTLLGPGPASFWRRRQLHETLVHLWDLRDAVGQQVDVAPTVWADTVDEVVTVMQPRQVRLGRMLALHRTIAIEAVDTGRTWVLGQHDGEPTVRVAGAARDLALVLWRRTPASTLRVRGERSALEAALAQAITP